VKLDVKQFYDTVMQQFEKTCVTLGGADVNSLMMTQKSRNI
jgi:hypothetical protein